MPIENRGRKIAIMTGGFVLVFILGALVSGLWLQKKVAKVENECAEAQKVAEKKASAIPEAPNVPVPNEVFSLGGTVTEIQDGTLTVKAFFFGQEKAYKVKIGDNTKIQKREMKKEIPKPEEGKPMEPFTTTDAKLEDIRQNDSVTIESDENIKDKTEFEAKTVYIEISNLPAPPASPVTSDMNSIPTPPPVPATSSKADNLPAPTDLPAPPAAPSAPK